MSVARSHRIPLQYYDWAAVDWSLSTSEIAASLGAPVTAVSRARRRHAPETLRPKKGAPPIQPPVQRRPPKKPVVMTDRRRRELERSDTVQHATRALGALLEKPRTMKALQKLLKREEQAIYRLLRWLREAGCAIDYDMNKKVYLLRAGALCPICGRDLCEDA